MKISPFHVRKPQIRITPKGVKVTKPSVRIGDKVGVNISSKGVSGSARTGIGTFNTRTGFTGKRRKTCCCPLVLLEILIPLIAIIGALAYFL